MSQSQWCRQSVTNLCAISVPTLTNWVRVDLKMGRLGEAGSIHSFFSFFFFQSSCLLCCESKCGVQKNPAHGPEADAGGVSIRAFSRGVNGSLDSEDGCSKVMLERSASGHGLLGWCPHTGRADTPRLTGPGFYLQSGCRFTHQAETNHHLPPHSITIRGDTAELKGSPAPGLGEDSFACR